MPKEDDLRVTDHAVLRYMERAMNLNVEIVREHILAICRGPAAVGAVSVRSEGVRFEIRNNAVLTVAPDAIRPSHTSRELNQNHIERKKRDHIERNPGSNSPRPLRSSNERSGAGCYDAPGTGSDTTGSSSPVSVA